MGNNNTEYFEQNALYFLTCDAEFLLMNHDFVILQFFVH